MRNIIFLDVDGVLNLESDSYTTAKSRENLCEPHLVERFNYLCRKMEEVEIVISSSWRKDMVELEKVLKESGFRYWDKVVGRTSISAHAKTLKRGEQIHEWLKKHVSVSFLPRIDAKIYIIDDEPEPIKKFWSMDSFFTDPAIGLTDEIVKEILKREKL